MEENKEACKSNGETRVNKEDNNKKEADEKEPELPLMSLNHVSRLCRNVEDSIDFYTKVLGFVLIERPPAFDFAGAWLFSYGVGVHLVQSNDEDKLSPPDSAHLDPTDNHISFQCGNMEAIEKRLKELDVKYIKRTVKDDQSGNAIDQMFFDDPDGFMIEICNCENFKLVQ
ncbi:hypothetical protein WN944_020644 [Citrus x changshan-huyou]|uniref:VOC domain-containing protein n=1 Tax=Citrus x changshan-huyou TaxID=2935761 RepID=A0AAP0LY84_9ROSI